MNKLKVLIGLEVKRQMTSYAKKGKAIEILLYILMLFSSFWLGFFLPAMLLSSSLSKNPSLETLPFKEAIKQSGLGQQALDLQAILAFLIAFITGFIMLKIVFFNKFDQNTLWALPLKKKEVLLSKFIGLLLPYLLPIFLFCLPTLIIAYLISDTLLYLPILLLSFYAIIVISLSLSMLLRLIFIKVLPQRDWPKWVKSLIALILMSIFLFLYFYEISQNFSNLFNFIQKYFLNLKLFSITSSIAQGNILIFILLCLFTLFCNFILYYFLEKNYFLLTSGPNTLIKKTKVEDRDYKVHSPLFSLVKKEIGLYWSNSAVVTNTFVSAFFLLFFAGAALVPSIQEKFFSFFATLEYFTRDTLLFFLLIFISGTMNISSFNFSLEAKMAYNTYTLPLSGKDIFKAKLLSSLVQLLPIYLLSFIIFVVSLSPTLKYIPLLLIGPLAYIVLNNSIGLFFDLKFANYLWDDPKQLAKQSKQAFFTGMGNLVISFIILLLGYQLLAYYPYLFCLSTTILLTVINILFYFLLKDIKVYHI